MNAETVHRTNVINNDDNNSSTTGDKREGLSFSTVVGCTATLQCHSVSPEFCREWKAGPLAIPASFMFLLLARMLC